MSKVFEALQRAEKEQGAALPVAGKEIEPEVSAQEADLAGLETLVSFAASTEESKHFRGRLSPLIVVHWQPESPIVEQIKRIRTHILHYSKTPSPPRTIMVTSALSGEGKSLLAANISVTIAQGLTESVLLVDSDMRNPTLHEYFGRAQSPGLSDYLANEAGLEGVIQETQIPRLKFIAGGSRKKNPIELISSEGMGGLISQVRAEDNNRFIVLDTTPVVLTNEPRILAKVVDGVILVVRHDVTHRNAVRDAVSFLEKDKIIGIVLNGSGLDYLGMYGRYGKYGKYGSTHH
jgi:protein-tyrosine kinase